MDRKFFNPSGLPNWSNSFSQAISVPNQGRTIYLSGQVGVDSDKNIVGENDLEAQTSQAFQNLIGALNAAGADARDVVKLTIYIKNYRRENAEAIGAAVSNFFPFENKPTATWLGVDNLSEEDFLIEIEAIAVTDAEN